MKLTVVTIGHRLPDWANEACEDYLKRFPPDWKVEVKALKAEPREGKPVAAIMQAAGSIAAGLASGICPESRDAIPHIPDAAGFTVFSTMKSPTARSAMS